MREEVIKFDLHDKIDHADAHQLKDLYGLITNYFNGHSDKSEWSLLPKYMQEKLAKSIEQADAGLGIPVSEAIKKISQKHGLNG